MARFQHITFYPKWGVHMTSICNLCMINSETLNHLVFGCSFSRNLRKWLANITNIHPEINTLADCWNMIEARNSNHSKIIILSSISNIIHEIWKVITLYHYVILTSIFNIICKTMSTSQAKMMKK